ncbi:MAG: hypothetical protein CMF31_02320 [Kordiimonas sp.]|nr:hypothetical protein [Kordiimonas sp.]|tara:strand:+ start:148 stop:633 length:486 start_codon:yes stop_codon:yes gene_type:complete
MKYFWQHHRGVTILLFISLAFNLFIAAAGLTAWYKHRHLRSSENFFHYVLQDLPEADQAVLMKKLTAFHRSIHQQRMEKHDVQRKIYEMLAADELDEDAIISQIENYSLLGTEVHRTVYFYLLETAKGLPDEQRLLVMGRVLNMKRHRGGLRMGPHSSVRD